GLQFGAKSECLGEQSPEFVPGGAPGEKPLSFGFLIGCSVAGDLALNRCTIRTANPVWFAGTKNVTNGCGLVIIDVNITTVQIASQGQGQFDIRHETKAASQNIARLSPGAGSIGKGDASNGIGAF